MKILFFTKCEIKDDIVFRCKRNEEANFARLFFCPGTKFKFTRVLHELFREYVSIGKKDKANKTLTSNTQ